MQETIEYMSRTDEGVVDVVGYMLLWFSIDMTCWKTWCFKQISWMPCPPRQLT